ncbi:MAG: hypothetical protein WED04_03065 [Promethearchaeati archaeon SRVP18_Atabeyarchaeia-1]
MCITLATVTWLIALFVLMRAWRNKDLRLLPFLLLDVIISGVFPFILSGLVALDLTTVQKLFLSAFLLYSTIGSIYLLFPSAGRRILIPFASLYLLLAVLQLLLRLLYDPMVFGFALFTYSFMDEVNIATLSALALTILLPFCTQLTRKIGILVDSRRLDGIVSSTEVESGNATRQPSSPSPESLPSSPSASVLRDAVRLFNQDRYRQCIEYCDTEVERMLLSKLGELCSARIDLPMRLQDQVTMLESKNIPIRGKGILQLRELRNRLTMSTLKSTGLQARWAIRVLRRTTRAFAGLEDSSPPSVESQQLLSSETPQ